MMKSILIYQMISLFLFCNLAGQDNSNRLTLVFAGDIMGHDSQIASAKYEEAYNYDTCFSFLQPYIASADIAIANLEVTLAGPPYKGYPRFSSPDELAFAARGAGFDLFITANNHSLDRNKEGLERTIDVLDKGKILRTGTFKNDSERLLDYPLIIEKNNIRLAILNYTYGTNGLKTEEPNIVNYTDREQIAKDLEKAKFAEPDFIIVTMHWGLEYQRSENIEQRELAEFIAKNGADAIIGSHPHVVQPVNKIHNGSNETLVVYSLGNFISNQRKRYTDGGILFELELEKKQKTRIIDYNYLPFWVYKPPRIDGGEHFVLLPSSKDKDFYNAIGMSEEDYIQLKLFNEDTSKLLSGIRQKEETIK